jgi:hypothetical protein
MMIIQILISATWALYALANRSPGRLPTKKAFPALIVQPSLENWGPKRAVSGCTGDFPVTCPGEVPCLSQLMLR